MSEKRIIEINGLKLEVDLSTARKIDEYKVGDNVKVLRKAYSGYEVLAGVIVEFVNFKELPTIIVAVFTQDYSGSKIEFVNFNANTEGIEITPCLDHELQLEKCRVLDKFNLEIERKTSQANELIAKRDWFIKYFHKYFNDIDG